jgi:hypothetical protein
MGRLGFVRDAWLRTHAAVAPKMCAGRRAGESLRGTCEMD